MRARASAWAISFEGPLVVAADEVVLPCEVAVVACRESVIGIGSDGAVVVSE